MRLVNVMPGGAASMIMLSVTVALARALGTPVNLELIIGAGFEAPGPALRVWSYLVQLVLSTLIGLLYAVGIEYLLLHPDPFDGALFALLRQLGAGLVIGSAPSLHPLIAQVLPAPGALAIGAGPLGVVTFIFLHLLYGTLVAEACGPRRRAVERRMQGKPCASGGTLSALLPGATTFACPTHDRYRGETLWVRSRCP